MASKGTVMQCGDDATLHSHVVPEPNTTLVAENAAGQCKRRSRLRND